VTDCLETQRMAASAGSPRRIAPEVALTIRRTRNGASGFMASRTLAPGLDRRPPGTRHVEVDIGPKAPMTRGPEVLGLPGSPDTRSERAGASPDDCGSWRDSEAIPYTRPRDHQATSARTLAIRAQDRKSNGCAAPEVRGFRYLQTAGMSKIGY